MKLGSPRLIAGTLAVLFLFTIALAGLALTPEAEADVTAQGCTHMSTRWVSDGCCSCNVLKQRKQLCIYGSWYNTNETRCAWGSCCAYPCCV